VQELRNLWYFVQVAEAGSFTAAASRLSLSTAALSKSVARLERHMGVPLFVRTSRTLHLTGEGRALLERVSAAFGTIEDSYRQVREISSDPAGVVRLSTVTAYGKHCVLPLLPRFFERYPRIDLVMSFHDGGRGLTRQAFDVRLNWGEQREQDKVSQTLCQMPLILVASPAYLVRRGTPGKPEDLQDHDCINVTLANGSRAHWTFVARTGERRQRSHITVTPKGRLLVMDELDAVADAAEAGLGLTVSSAENVLGALREGRLVRVLEDYAVLGQGEMNSAVIIQYARKKALPSKVRVLVAFLLEELKGRDPLDIVARATDARTSSGSR
jgi:DNA-binding transcriptional LysR family regulator